MDFPLRGYERSVTKPLERIRFDRRVCTFSMHYIYKYSKKSTSVPNKYFLFCSLAD